MIRNRKAKIVATLGPASSTPQTIRALFDAGGDVFRLNFSHGAPEDHRTRVDCIRQIETETGRPIAILMDLQGPKLRVGKFATGPVDLKPGSAFRLDMTPTPGDAKRVTLAHPEISQALEPGTDLLLDDGRLRLRVERCGPDFAETIVVIGGKLSDRKGVNVPGVVLPISAMTDKDRQDLTFGLGLGVDWVALSFVQRPDDVAEARRLIDKRAAVLIKLEKPAAIDRLTELIEQSDAVMVARGDLGVEMPPEDVPGPQKRIIAACREKGKPVVVATQMLDSMVHAPTPTRAEASDVATAIYDGADAVMLSAESATGQYPREAVEMMDRIIRSTEQHKMYRSIIEATQPDEEKTPPHAVAAAAADLASVIHAAAIVAYTSSGTTAGRIAHKRPRVPILATTTSVEVSRRLCLLWGAHSVLCENVQSYEEMVRRATELAKREEFAGAGDTLVVVAGIPLGRAGTTNNLRVVSVS